MPHQIDITLTDAGDMDISPDEKVCSLAEYDSVKWTCNKDHWRVLFGPNAPVHPKVAGPGKETVRLTAGKRSGDFADVKYTVVVWTGDKLRDVDPKLIVKP
jgi:hypothetical protein